MGRDEVLEHRQAFTEVGLNRTRDDFTLGVSHKSTHTGDLTHLHHVSASTRVDHHPHRVGGRTLEVFFHGGRNFVGGTRPDFNEFLTALIVTDQTAGVLLFDLVGFDFVCFQNAGLGRRSNHVVN